MTTNKTIGFGLMNFTWKAEPVEDSIAFAAMKSAVQGGALHWSSAAFYGPPEDPLGGVRLIKRYFDKYPADAEKVQLYVKGCFDGKTFTPTCSPEQIRTSVKSVTDILGTYTSNLYFGPARRDKTTPLKTSMETFKQLIDEKTIKGVFLSEVGADTIKEAHSVQPLSAIEVEFSLWSPDLLENGVAQVTKDNDIPILAYSPLGRGFLTGAIRTKDDLPPGDVRLRMERFQGENFDKNVQAADRIVQFSQKLNVTPAQVALGWIYAQQKHAGTIIPIPGASTAKRVEENTTLVKLSDDQVAELDRVMPHADVAGGRASQAAAHMLWA